MGAVQAWSTATPSWPTTSASSYVAWFVHRPFFLSRCAILNERCVWQLLSRAGVRPCVFFDEANQRLSGYSGVAFNKKKRI